MRSAPSTPLNNSERMLSVLKISEDGKGVCRNTPMRAAANRRDTNAGNRSNWNPWIQTKSPWLYASTTASRNTWFARL